MTLLKTKTGNQTETFGGVLKQKLGKQHSWGFKQHLTSGSINQDNKFMEKKEKKSVKNNVHETVQFPEEDANVDEKRGFVPSDVHDPNKREFLTQLSKRIFTEKRTQNLFSKLRVLIQADTEVVLHNFCACLYRNDVLIGSEGYPSKVAIF